MSEHLRPISTLKWKTTTLQSFIPATPTTTSVCLSVCLASQQQGLTLVPKYYQVPAKHRLLQPTALLLSNLSRSLTWSAWPTCERCCFPHAVPYDHHYGLEPLPGSLIVQVRRRSGQQPPAPWRRFCWTTRQERSLTSASTASSGPSARRSGTASCLWATAPRSIRSRPSSLPALRKGESIPRRGSRAYPLPPKQSRQARQVS